MANDNKQIATGFIAPMRHERMRLGDVTPNSIALVDVRCRTCQKLLFRGALRGELKCPRCGHMNRWDK
jgi:hypothetical protein